MCTRKNTKKPLNRENTCPRWYSNCIPTLANIGLPRKHAESGPIRPMYDPVPSPKRAQCAHTKTPFRAYQPPTASALKERGFETLEAESSPVLVDGWRATTCEMCSARAGPGVPLQLGCVPVRASRIRFVPPELYGCLHRAARRHKSKRQQGIQRGSSPRPVQLVHAHDHDAPCH
jgi:hypothetical protein